MRRPLNLVWLQIQVLLIGGSWLAAGPVAAGWVAIGIGLLVGVHAGQVAIESEKKHDGDR